MATKYVRVLLTFTNQSDHQIEIAGVVIHVHDRQTKLRTKARLARRQGTYGNWNLTACTRRDGRAHRLCCWSVYRILRNAQFGIIIGVGDSGHTSNKHLAAALRVERTRLAK